MYKIEIKMLPKKETNHFFKQTKKERRSFFVNGGSIYCSYKAQKVINYIPKISKSQIQKF